MISANAVPEWINTHLNMDLKMPLVFTFTRQTSPAFESFIPKLISEIPRLTLLQSLKLFMLLYMATPSALRLDDGDTATYDVVAICLRLAALLDDLKSKPGTFTRMESSIQVSLIAKFCLTNRTSDTGALLAH
ncbi:hypothetical protein TNCV_4334631 [Trichonephila clavipes]|nr:hypothetical protein TNCV_4334631 [Trichonephila clavipes]